MPVTPDLLQQHGFVHAGATTAVVDSACGYATLSLLPPGSEVVTVEFKMNLLAPALGVKMIAHGWVVRPGRTLTVCQGELFGEDESGSAQAVRHHDCHHDSPLRRFFNAKDAKMQKAQSFSLPLCAFASKFQAINDKWLEKCINRFRRLHRFYLLNLLNLLIKNFENFFPFTEAHAKTSPLFYRAVPARAAPGAAAAAAG
ncbi:MAG: PaaI family thioesterase [Anaerolineaceae bacterium]|nr:PaaI family thioesterase [Anaerolineaceae bacterium]